MGNELDRQLEAYRHNLHEADNRLAKLRTEHNDLKRRLQELDWQPITSDNLPKVGDEVYSMPQPGCFYPDEPGMVFNPLRVEDLRTFKGWTWAPRPFTHFRPINAPKPGEKPAI